MTGKIKICPVCGKDPKQRHICYHCGADLENSKPMKSFKLYTENSKSITKKHGNQGVSLEEGAQTKKCPYCAEEIKIEAIKCKHCGSIVDDKVRRIEEQKKTQPKEGPFLQTLNLGCLIFWIFATIVAVIIIFNLANI